MEMKEAMVEVRDGANLATSVTLPGSASYPVIIVRTVYGRSQLAVLGRIMSRFGYATVIQDVRGSGDSSGQFGFLKQEPSDAIETAQWILSQPWCNGHLAILGISYLSAASIAIAVEFPEQTKAAIWVTVPVSANTLLYDTGVLRLHHALPWVISLPWGMESDASLNEFHPSMYEKVPLIHAVPPELNAPWTDMLEEGPTSSFWRENDLEHYVRECKVPGIHFGGWYDFLLDATLGPYQVMAKSGVPQRLILGPWSHNGIVGNEKITGDICYGCDKGRNGEVSLSSRFVQESAEWLDYWMKGSGDLTSMASVKVFYTGYEPHWEEEQFWPGPGSTLTAYLSKGRLCKDLDEIEASGSYDRYTYDPWNPTPTEGGAVWAFPEAGLEPGPCVSHIHSRGDVLVYDSESLEKPLRILGNPRVNLHASSSAPDTDFTAALFDVDPQGVSRYVADGITRARYRKGFCAPEFLEPYQTYLFQIDMKGCAHTFGPGHKLRLVIGSSNFPKFDRNPNMTEPIYQNPEMEKATQTVRYGSQTPSKLLLPVPE